jgi:hypothetical protein
MQVKHLENKTITYRNIKLNGLSIIASLNGAAGSGSTSVDFTKSTIQVILNRNQIPHVIYTGNLKLVGLASSLDTLNQLSFGNTLPIGQTLTAGQQAVISFNIPFGGVVDLHGDDEIYLEVQNSSGLFTVPALEPSSYLEIKPIKCYGTERFIPSIRTWVIQANEQNNQYMLGDNLIRLAVLNYDKTSFENNVINNLIFSSDRLDDTYTYRDLIARKLTRFNKQLIPYTHGDISLDIQEDQSFMITDFHEEYDNVNLEIQFNGANVAASQNYLVAWTYYTDWTILNKAEDKEASYRQKTAEKISASVKK